MKSVLTVAGADPTGGAGIQADLRTFTALCLSGWSVITALTVQDTHGVRSVMPVPPEVLRAQLRTVLNDAANLTAIKIGMLAGADHVEIVAEELMRSDLRFTVCDPVLASSGGVSLLSQTGRGLLGKMLFPLCTLITPNLDEAAALAGMERAALDTEKGIATAACRLLDQGARAVLIKGGHRDGAPIDTLFAADGTSTRFPGKRIATSHTHGTGCLLSSAITGYLAQGLPLAPAIEAAKALLSRALITPTITGAGRGYPDAMRGIRTTTGFEMQSFSSFTAFVPSHRHERRVAGLHGLYVLTDSGLRPDRSPERIVRAALTGGARVVQLREKRLPTPALITLARRLAAIAHEADALFIVNDRVDVALAANADGVHLGPDDMPPSDARRLLGPDYLIGVSVSSSEEAISLAPYASYLGIGAIFGSATKTDAGPPVGIERIREIADAFPQLPLVAIGGINGGNIGAVGTSGVACAAVVSAVVCAPEMTAATAALCAAFNAVSRTSVSELDPFA